MVTNYQKFNANFIILKLKTMETNLFEAPISFIKVRKGIIAYKYRNGTVNINGTKYLCYSIKDAIKLWRKNNPINY